MNVYLKNLIQKYRQKGILIDTNLLLLYIFGSVDAELIARFKRTSQFTTDDFDKVSDFIRLFDKIIFTPHIVTEVSDFIGNKTDLQLLLKIYVENFDEHFIESKEIVQKPEFIKFGLADTAIIETDKQYLIFTDDNLLFGFLQNSNFDTVNLNQLRLL